jgi:1,4-dihydroxy-2-naphthoyl-CoA hydrolase
MSAISFLVTGQPYSRTAVRQYRFAIAYAGKCGAVVVAAMGHLYARTVHFADTDAAGVVYFANYLSICHEAYEEALAESGLRLGSFFADTGTIVPISKSEAEYKRPLACGDRLTITTTPRRLSENTFEVRYELTRLGPPDKLAAVVRTEHVCIRSATRERLALPPPLAAWVDRG